MHRCRAARATGCRARWTRRRRGGHGDGSSHTALRRRDEAVDWDIGVSEATVVDLDALPDETLDRVVDVPHVDVHAGDDAVVADPEGDELAARGIAAEHHAVPVA